MLKSLTPRELATVLAALRYWQTSNRDTATAAPEYAAIATDNGNYDPMSDREIDTLCEKLNA